jgi:hypothetical protein
MKQSALLEFHSSAFAIEAGEDDDTNPGIFGKVLANWLAEQLRSRGIAVGTVIAEDFGWCVPIRNRSAKLYVACASTEECHNHWRVFVFAEGGLLARIAGKDKSAEAIAALYATIKRILEGSAGIRELRETAS